jgi:hypothetical protein
VRAVAQACASNAIAIAIPCHRSCARRVDLRLRWGVARKRALLARERALQERPATATAAVLRERASAAASPLAARIAALDWTQIAQALDAHGCATTGALTSGECNQLAASYASDEPRIGSSCRDMVWAGRVQIFRLSAAGTRRGSAPGTLSAAR